MNAEKKESIVKNLTMVIPIFISFIALAVQWGTVTTRLELFDKSIDQFRFSLEKQGDKIDRIEESISFIKGKLDPQ